MIKIDYQEININNELVGIIKDKMSENTCKTNISPQLMFKQSYTGITNKIFVGNWTKNGFWISKFKNQLIDLRPDIIARFSFCNDHNLEKVKIRYSMGFSSLFYGLFGMLIFSSFFMALGEIGFIFGIIIFWGLYYLLAIIELNRMKRKIKEKLLRTREI